LCSEFLNELDRRLQSFPLILPVYRHWQYEAGRDKIKLLLDTIQKSHKVIIIFSKGYMDDTWNEYCTNHAIMDKLGEETLIPICLPGGDVPNQLMCTVHLEFAHNWQSDEVKWNKLISVLQHNPQQVQLENKGMFLCNVLIHT
jgi:hypothetical protein